MRRILLLMFVLVLPNPSRADSFNCKLVGILQGQLVREFMLRPPGAGRVVTSLPGNTYRITVWTYEASIGVEIENLVSHSSELTTQSTFESSRGNFDLAFKAADVRLTCTSEQ